MMDKELLAKWIAALRSGEYKQTRNRLRDSRGYCALGVLCDVIDPTAWKRSVYTGGWVWHGNETALPPRIAKEVGMQPTSLSFHHPIADGRSITDLNDRCGSTFIHIAEVLESSNDIR